MPTKPATFTFQVRLLLHKNYYMLRRNHSSTLLQVGVGVFFLCLLFLINAGLNSNTRSEALLSEATDLPQIHIPDLRPCTTTTPTTTTTNACYTFAFAPYEPNPVHRDPTTTFTQAVVTSLARQYALPAIGAPHGPLGFHNETAMLEWLVAQDNQGRVAVGVTFNGKTTDAATRHNVGYRLRYNDTQTCTDFGTTCTDTLKNVVLPLQVALDGAFTSVVLGGTGTAATATVTATPPSHYNISMKPFPHPDLPFKRDAMQQYGDMFLFAAFMFNFILQLSYLVTEKELRLREAMKQMGLQSSAYWTSWLITNTCLNVVQVLLLCGTGCLFQFDFFLKNAFLLYFCFFFVTSMALTLASFFLSALLSQAEQARNLGFLLFIVFFIGAKGLVAGKVFKEVVFGGSGGEG